MENKLQNTNKSTPDYNYSALATHVALNYTIFKTGKNYQNLLNKVFNEHVKVKNSVYFLRNSKDETIGSGRYTFFATRYDYLRIAKSMLDDWQNDTCVGKYLKTIFDRQEKKDGIRIQTKWARSYAGMFQTNYELFPKKRPVMGMHGYGGQHVVIDFENSRIVITNSIHENWDFKRIVYEAIRKGID